jgi:hypothetical protein
VSRRIDFLPRERSEYPTARFMLMRTVVKPTLRDVFRKFGKAALDLLTTKM